MSPRVVSSEGPRTSSSSDALLPPMSQPSESKLRLAGVTQPVSSRDGSVPPPHFRGGVPSGPPSVLPSSSPALLHTTRQSFCTDSGSNAVRFCTLICYLENPLSPDYWPINKRASALYMWLLPRDICQVPLCGFWYCGGRGEVPSRAVPEPTSAPPLEAPPSRYIKPKSLQPRDQARVTWPK